MRHIQSLQWQVGKDKVSSTGVYQLTNELIRRAGFSNPDKVKIYGYGGNLQNEVLMMPTFVPMMI